MKYKVLVTRIAYRKAWIKVETDEKDSCTIRNLALEACAIDAANDRNFEEDFGVEFDLDFEANEINDSSGNLYSDEVDYVEDDRLIEIVKKRNKK